MGRRGCADEHDREDGNGNEGIGKLLCRAWGSRQLISDNTVKGSHSFRLSLVVLSSAVCDAYSSGRELWPDFACNVAWIGDEECAIEPLGDAAMRSSSHTNFAVCLALNWDQPPDPSRIDHGS